MKRDYPFTCIVVWSPLAEGADRLVAREALELGCRLVVPMPFEQTEYESDFESSESVDEFRALLARADRAFVVPHDGGQNEDRSSIYARCAAYVVKHCVELIALWDGRVNGRVGGAADSVAFKLEGIPTPYVPESNAFDMAFAGPVLHVQTQRAKKSTHDAPPTTSVSTRLLYPPMLLEAEARNAFDKVKRNIDQFNRDVLRLAGDNAHEQATDTRIQVELVAGRYQRRVGRSLIAIFLLIFFAAVGFNVYLYLAHHPLVILLAYLTFSGAASAIYFVTRNGAWQERYQDSRALAEALRVAEYWRLANVNESVANCIARAQHAEVDWLPVAVRALTEPVGELTPREDSETVNRLRVVDDRWIVDQQEYFARIAGGREHRHERIAATIAMAGIVLSVAISIVVGLLSRVGYTSEAIALVATNCALAAALIRGYADKRGWSEHARRYDRMALLFARAHVALAEVLDAGTPNPREYVRARVILRRLGEEAIRENVSWLTLHRTRPIEVPHT
ncbi:MAG: hypothetical protein JOZ77_08855 [Candidatus Eremiobacteraeota bacterium]|nr:hypothetical protein [Candidatus Eremiobacteraeota bacterium]